MTFEELWVDIWKEAKLPSEAKKLLPQSLSEKTKQTMLKSKKSPAEIAIIVNNAVEMINCGSVKTLDSLIMKRLSDV